MRWKAFIIAVLVTASSSGFAAILNEPTLEIRVPVPPDWVVLGDSGAYPIDIVHGSGDAELLLFRTELAINQSINSADDFKQSVQKVIDSVVMSLPGAKLLTNTGYNEINRLGFALEFVSSDPTDNAPLRHRLVGWLYRHTDGHQVLFTLWGKGRLTGYLQHDNDFKSMQADFAYTGEVSNAVLSSNRSQYMVPLLLIVIIVAALLYFRSAKLRTARQKPFTHRLSWSCSCGHRNTTTAVVCKACGKPHSMQAVR